MKSRKTGNEVLELHAQIMPIADGAPFDGECMRLYVEMLGPNEFRVLPIEYDRRGIVAERLEDEARREQQR